MPKQQQQRRRQLHHHQPCHIGIIKLAVGGIIVSAPLLLAGSAELIASTEYVSRKSSRARSLECWGPLVLNLLLLKLSHVWSICAKSGGRHPKTGKRLSCP